MEYLYVTQDFRVSTIDYSYSKFNGLSFIKAYIDYRSNFISTEVFEESFVDTQSLFICEEDFIDYICTKKFLNKCLKESFNKNKEEFDLLIKRFEVTKKVYSFYDTNFRPHSTCKNDLRLEYFIAFSHTLSEIYGKTENFKYLNSLLKVNDILCSAYNQLSQKEKMILAFLIKKEVDFVKALSNKLNIYIS